ncbi:MAG TPA: PTS sugar transporter subunit IIA [Pirellulales bacterium]|jgi:PTS system nitrogen regulatory IIA component|nr:PTS sugar transporter subunit IIA [Pirellulales bacterium]
MTDDDFDLAGLADYLHMAPAQVQRMADRGLVPGRKTGGAWRFSRPEIHQWLEERIGVGDELELLKMEAVIERDRGPADDALLPAAELLVPQAIEMSLTARTRDSVITTMVGVASRTGWLWDPQRMVDAVRSREQLYPTALDNGVALLHPRRPLPATLERAFIAFGRTPRAIPFGSRSGALTDLFFLLCSTSDRGHLHALARLSRIINDNGFLSTLRSATDVHSAHELIAHRERQLQ